MSDIYSLKDWYPLIPTPAQRATRIPQWVAEIAEIRIIINGLSYFNTGVFYRAYLMKINGDHGLVRVSGDKEFTIEVPVKPIYTEDWLTNYTDSAIGVHSIPDIVGEFGPDGLLIDPACVSFINPKVSVLVSVYSGFELKHASGSWYERPVGSPVEMEVLSLSDGHNTSVTRMPDGSITVSGGARFGKGIITEIPYENRAYLENQKVFSANNYGICSLNGATGSVQVVGSSSVDVDTLDTASNITITLKSVQEVSE
jgi:hypothetical protein